MLMAATMVMGITACNSGSDTLEVDLGYNVDNMYSSTAVTAFNIKANSKILANLDSLFFTIDLENCRIFNADSLPKGTDVTKLVPNISAGNAATMEMIVKGSKIMKDTTFTYTSESTDSIDFSPGTTITLRVKSGNEKYTHDYSIKVNVHKLATDSLAWNNTAWLSFPGNPTAQKTVEYGDRVLTLMSTPDGLKLWSVEEPATLAVETIDDVTFGADPDILSFTAGDNTLYCLDTDGNLYTSTDGLSWTATDTRWHSIYGVYGNSLLGVEKDADGTYYHVTYPATTRKTVPAACPVSGTSDMLIFDSKWNDSPVAFMIGGRCADGTLTSAAWAYDGTIWACLSVSSPSVNLEGITLFPYLSYKKGNRWWRVYEYSTLYALGGRDASGNCNRKVYISRDAGVNWTEAPSLLQLPDYLPSVAFAQAIVRKSELTVGSRVAPVWNEVAAPLIPAWMTREVPSYSRAITPITSWECPYIYLYGGLRTGGALVPQVWRGAINRLTFKPLE